MSTRTDPRTPNLLATLKWPAIVLAILAVGGAIVGYLVSGVTGMISGLLGAAMWLVFLALTAISIQLANRVTRDDPGSPVFFAIVIGSWLLKIVLFVAIALWLRSQSWLDPTVFYVTVIVAVVGSMVMDVIAFQRSRVPYVGEVELPQAPSAPDERAADSPR